MYKYLLQSVDGIQWFGISALLIFFTAFCVAFLRAYFLSNKADLDHLASLPLEDQQS
ncbi:MAG: CcoQ/FixQ family Cbb3-type cytochrome c oxidase assembly chaperone [Bacteroidetes bacterium]|nr:CcoQ/FixQ family Cbb3-type cytochrome c oxidase assembly chaperone [Bacteroidota bacterium]